jgi:dethiobiotin synthetase
MRERLFVTGIGTDVGKTIVSAILVEALKADYWKPIKAGDLAYSDTHRIQELARHHGKIFPSSYELKTAASPHYAASIDGVSIDLKKCVEPNSENHIIVEGAGGVFVPLNQSDLIIDLIAALKMEVVLVSRNYLGSINHTLLTVEALNNRKIPIRGVVFNGEPAPSSEEIIVARTGLPVLFRIGHLGMIDSGVVDEYAKKAKIRFDG